MKSPRQVNKIFISAADIDRGYIDVPATALGGGKSDGRAEDRLLAEGLNWPFREAKVGARADEPPRQPSLAEETAGVPHCRFTLAENARPGSYDWPLTVSPQHL